METAMLHLIRRVNTEFRSIMCADGGDDLPADGLLDEARMEELCEHLDQVSHFMDPPTLCEQDFGLNPEVAEYLENVERMNVILDFLSQRSTHERRVLNQDLVFVLDAITEDAPEKYN